jgi:hypothetical protein
MIATVVRPGEQCVFAIERKRTDGSLDGVAVEFDPAVIEEASEPLPARERIAWFDELTMRSPRRACSCG